MNIQMSIMAPHIESLAYIFPESPAPLSLNIWQSSWLALRIFFKEIAKILFTITLLMSSLSRALRSQFLRQGSEGWKEI